MQVGAVHVEPNLGAIEFRIETLHQPPEPQRMIEFQQMADLVPGKVLEHEWGRENEAPGKGQHARIRARTATARLVAHTDALDANPELVGVTPARGLQLALRLALEEVADAAVDVRRFARDAEQPAAICVGLGPHGAAHAAAVDNAMRLTAQRHVHAMRERRQLRQPLEPRGDPAAVLLREFFCFLDAAARRHGEDHFACGSVDAQRVAARLAMTAHAHEIDRLVENDLDDRGLARSINDLAAVRRKPRVTHHAKSLAERAFVQHCGRETLPGGRPRDLAYSLAALAIAGGAALVRNAGGPTLLGGRRAAPRATAALFDSTKSETRGTISARK